MSVNSRVVGAEGSTGRHAVVAETRATVRCAAGERGSITAEFATALPAVMLCLALCLGAVQAAAQQSRLLDHAASAARLIGRGDPPPASSPGATRSVGHESGMVCVTVSAPSGVGGLGALGMAASARSCVLDEGEQR
jgi:hypothetical protein